MEMVQKLDAGPIVAQREVPLRSATYADELSQQLAFFGRAYFAGSFARLVEWHSKSRTSG